MIDNESLVFYGSVAVGAVIFLGAIYVAVGKFRSHGKTHNPQVLGKINDFFSTQDSSRGN